MSESLQSYQLNNVNDFKFLACVVGEKLRNPNFQSGSREVFLKTLIEEIRPYCSFKSLERIEKSVQQIGKQKDQEEREIKNQKKVLSNKKDKGLVSAKESGRLNQYGVDIDDYGSEEDDYEDDGEDEYAKYQK